MGGSKPNEYLHTFKPTTDTSLRVERHVKKLKVWKQKPSAPRVITLTYIVLQFTEYF